MKISEKLHGLRVQIQTLTIKSPMSMHVHCKSVLSIQGRLILILPSIHRLLDWSTEQKVHVESPLPTELEAVLEYLASHSPGVKGRG